MTIRGKIWTAGAWMAFHWIASLCMTQTASAQQTLFVEPVTGVKATGKFNCTTCFKQNWYHTAHDIPTPTGKSVPVGAANVGEVHALIKLGAGDHGFGNCVILRHAVVINAKGNTATYYTLYGHLESFASGLKVGQAVGRGQLIGMMGNTGAGDGSIHLHFEVKTAGVTQNPCCGGPYWGYTPYEAQKYGYIDPATVIGKWAAIPLSSKN